MTWFDIKQLEKDLIAGNISEKDVFNYLLTSSLIVTIVPYLADGGTSNKILTLTELILGVVFTIVSLKSTFDINNKGDNKDYLKRYTSLSLISFIRVITFALAPVFVFVIIIKILEAMDIITYGRVKDIFLIIIVTCCCVAYYFMLTNSFRRVNART